MKDLGLSKKCLIDAGTLKSGRTDLLGKACSGFEK